MRSYEEIIDDMEPDSNTFSNMSEFESWAAGWCARCVHEDDCAVVDAAIIHTHHRPLEWIRVENPDERKSYGRFRCTALTEGK